MSLISSKYLSLSCISLCLICGTFTYAERTRKFDIESGNARDSLREFGKQSQMSLIFDFDEVVGVQTNEVIGVFTAPEALGQLLSGTVLGFDQDVETGAFAVIRLEEPSPKLSLAQASGNLSEQPNANPNQQVDTDMNKNKNPFGKLLSGLLGLTVASASASAQSADDQVFDLNPYEINVAQDTGYGVTATLGGTRINTTLVDTPVNVAVLNQQMIEDLNARDFADLATFVAGGTKTGSTRANQTTFRGVTLFGAGAAFRDGIPEQNQISGASIVDTFAIQRIEFIKGPAGVLFGAHPIGGVINRISKRPMRRDHLRLGAQYNSYFNGNSSYSTTLDWNKTFGEEKQFQSRLLLHWSDGNTFTGGRDEFTGITPMFSYDLDEGSRVWLRLSYNDQHIQEHRGTWWRDADGNLPFGIVPVDRVTGNPNDNGEGQIGTAWNYELGFTDTLEIFGQEWVSRLLFRQSEADGTFKIYLTPNKSVVDAAGNSLGRIGRGPILWSEYASMLESGQASDIVIDPFIARGRDFNRKDWNLSYDLTTNFWIGQSNHTLFTYVGLSDGRTRQDWFRWDYDPMGVSVFDVRGVPRDSVLSNLRREGNRPELGTGEGINWAIQDQASFLNDRLIIVGGARYDDAENIRISTEDARDPGVITSPLSKNSDWSYKYGLVAKPLSEGALKDDFSVFFNHSETFTPNATTNQLGEPLPNIRGEMDEFGFKMSFMDGKLTGTASFFTITENNVREIVNIPDPEDPSVEIIVTRPIGTRDIEGWDLDLTWQPTDSFSLYASLQDLTKGEVGARNPGSGGQARGVPVGFNYVAVGRYDFIDGPLDGFFVGANARKVVERAADTGDTFRVPGFELFGLLAGYQGEDWRVQLNLENVTDEEYVSTAVNDFLISPGEPLNAVLSFEYSF